MSSQSTPQFVTKTATSTSAFIDSIGVNTHLAFNSSPYANISEVSASLNYLGIHNVRDGLYTTTLASSGFSTLAAQGYKFDLAAVMSNDWTVNVSKLVSTLDSYASQYPGSIIAIEGLNEVNNWKPVYNGVSSIASGAEIQKQLFAAVNADTLLKDIAVYNVSIGSTDTSQFNQLGNLSNYTDYANEHAYVMSTTNISSGLDFLLSFAQISAPGKPTVITEAGYTTLSSYWYDGVDESVQAKYTLNTLMDAYLKGVSHTYLYELLDEPNLGANNSESYFGLFHADGTPKIAATAIHNLTQILQDNGQSASAASNSLTYALSGTPATSHDMVFAKSNGSVDLVLWAEPVLWNQNTHSEIQATSSPVTVTFSQTEALVKVYDPLLGTSPIATYANVSSIQVSVSDHPLVIEVTPVVKAISAPLASVASNTSSSYVAGLLASETTTFAAGSSDLSDTKSYTAGVLTRETILHADNSKDVYIYNVKNQSYVTEHDTFDASGTMTSMVRTHADGTFAYSYNLATDGTKTTDIYSTAGIIASDTVVHADGSSDVKIYLNGTIVNDTVKYASGSIVSDTKNYTNGVLTSEIVRFPVGAETKTYTAGILTRDDIVHADNTEDVYLYGIKNQAYVAGHDVYSASRVLTSSVRTHADGTLAYTYNLAADGTKTTDLYDSVGNLTSDNVVHADGSSDTKTYANGALIREAITYTPGSADLSETKVYTAGVLTSDTIVHADKSKDVYLSNVTNKSYVAEHDVYNTAGVLTSTVRSHADGSFDYTYRVSADGTKTTDIYNAAGVVTSDTVLRLDGSSEVKTYTNGMLTSDMVKYAAGSADFSDSKLYTAGALTSDTIVHADKSKDVYLSNVTNKSYVAEHDVYNTAGVLTSTVRSHADGSLDYSYRIGADGTKTTDTYDAAGVVTSNTVLRLDASSEVKTYTNGTLTSDIVKYAAGSPDFSDARTFVSGILVKETVVHADKSKDGYDWNISGKSYVADHFAYNTAGQLVTSDYTNVDGSHTQQAYVSGASLISTKTVTDTFTAASAGGDSFIFKPNSGNDTIVGFHAGNAANHDTIMIDKSVVSDFSHLAMQQVGKDTLITLDAHDSILLKNVAPTALTSADFQFFAHHDLVV